MRCLKTTVLEHKALWKHKNGKKIFVKISASNFRNQHSSFRGGIDREQTCLKVLEGLAVPELVKIKKKDLPKIPGVNRALITATSFAVHKDVHNVSFKPYELMAVWVFFVEQLVAFRRHQILYTDFKCANLLGQKKPLKVIIIDFDHSFPITVKRLKKLPGHGFTPGFESPESKRGEMGNESSLVYECCSLLYHFMTNRNNQFLKHPKYGINRALKIIHAQKAYDLARALKISIQNDPKKRPQDYEELFETIEVNNLPKHIFNFYKKLRKPYLKRLAEVGL